MLRRKNKILKNFEKLNIYAENFDKLKKSRLKKNQSLRVQLKIYFFFISTIILHNLNLKKNVFMFFLFKFFFKKKKIKKKKKLFKIYNLKKKKIKFLKKQKNKKLLKKNKTKMKRMKKKRNIKFFYKRKLNFTFILRKKLKNFLNYFYTEINKKIFIKKNSEFRKIISKFMRKRLGKIYKKKYISKKYKKEKKQKKQKRKKKKIVIKYKKKHKKKKIVIKFKKKLKKKKKKIKLNVINNNKTINLIKNKENKINTYFLLKKNLKKEFNLILFVNKILKKLKKNYVKRLLFVRNNKDLKYKKKLLKLSRKKKKNSYKILKKKKKIKLIKMKKNFPIKKYKKDIKNTIKKRLKRNRRKKYYLIFRFFLKESRVIVKKFRRRRSKKKSLIFRIKYLLLKIATKDINYIKIKLKVKNIFISFFKRLKGLFVKATCGIYGFTGAKKATSFAYEHTAKYVSREYYKKTFILMKYKNIRDKLANRRKKRKACIVNYGKSPLFFNLQHSTNRRQIRSILKGFKKSRIGITFLTYNPKSAHNGLWLRKKRRV